MVRRLILFLLCAVTIFAVPREMAAQEPTASPAVSQALPPGVDSPDPAAATRAWLDSVPADKRAKSDAYFEGGYWLLLWNFLLSAAIMIFLLASGISVRLRNFAEQTTRWGWLQTILYAIPFLLIVLLLSFPLSIYQDFVRDHAYGLSTRSFGSWLSEQAVMLIPIILLATLLLVVLYAVFRRAPRTWWLWAVGVITVFTMFVRLISPIYLAPLINKYQPLKDPAISESILQMARANQIPVGQVYEFDASRQSNRISANVSGFMGTTRIALNDNLLKQCTLPEIRSVMAHEMGHYVLNHVDKLLLYTTVTNFVMFVLVYLFFNWAIRRRGERWQLRGISDLAALPLLVLVLVTVSFFFTPITNSITRVTEREADAFGLNTAREPVGWALAALKLGTYRKLDPGPLEEFIFYDHPSGRARIRMGMDWKAAKLPAGSTTP